MSVPLEPQPTQMLLACRLPLRPLQRSIQIINRHHAIMASAASPSIGEKRDSSPSVEQALNKKARSRNSRIRFSYKSFVSRRAHTQRPCDRAFCTQQARRYASYELVCIRSGSSTQTPNLSQSSLKFNHLLLLSDDDHDE